MPRVLHLTDPEPDYQTRRAVDALAAEGDSARHVVGRFTRSVSALRGHAPFRADVVHAWGMRALAAAALGAQAPVVFSPTGFPTRRTAGWLRAVMSYRPVHVVCPSATQRRVLVERGVPADRCHLIRPGVDFSRVRRRRDADLRARLGFSDADRVVLAAGESARAAAHELALQSVAIAHFLEERYRMLLWGRGPRAGAVSRLAGRVAGTPVLAVAGERLGRAVEFEELLPAADAVLVTARAPVPTLPIAVCMAAGLPIVSTVTYTVAELLEDRHTALMVPRPDARLIAKRLMDLEGDAGLQWSIADMARTEAYEYFSLTRFRDQHRAAYEQLATGRKAEIPEPAPGAGRRFHGRG